MMSWTTSGTPGIESGIRNRVRFHFMIVFVVALAICRVAEVRAEGDGVEWSPLTFDLALAEAGKTGQLVFVDLYSDHCGQCGQLDIEVFSQEEGAQLTDGMIAIKLDSASRSSYPFKSKYPVTGLPAIIVIDPDGNEVDRVVGYHGKDDFLSRAFPMRDGVDPIPDIEAQLDRTPGNLALMAVLLEKYIYRKREAEAEKLIDEIIALDPKNSAQESEKALREMAKYQSHFKKDFIASDRYWRRLVEEFPYASSSGAAVKATYETANAQGKLDLWKEWICGITSAHPRSRINYSAAMWANRGGLRGQCLSDAAMNAKKAGIGPAWMDSIAVVLAGQP